MKKKKLKEEELKNVCECVRYKKDPVTGELKVIESYKYINEPRVNKDGSTSLKIKKFDIYKAPKTSRKKKKH